MRQLVAHGATYASTLLLARWLAPELFGLFVVAGPLMVAVAGLADLGVGAALVQRAQAPDRAELRAAFTLTLAVTLVVAAGAAAAAPAWASRGGLPADHVPPLIVLAGLFCLFPLRSVPLLLLERDMEFPTIAMVEACGTLTYQATLVASLGLGVGPWSLPVATAGRLLLELGLLARARPFRPGLAGKRGDLWTAVRGGFRYQFVRGLSVVKDNLPALLVAPALGAAAFGQLQWAIVYAGMPVYLTALISRLAFSAVARLQADRAAAGRAVEAMLRLTASIGLPGSAVLLLWSAQLVPLLFGERWLASRPLVVAITPNMAAGVVVGTLLSALNGIGRVGHSARLSTAWVLITYALAAAAISGNQGVAGVAWSYSISAAVMAVAAYRPLARDLALSARAVWTVPLLATAGVIAIGVTVRLLGRGAWTGLAAAGLVSSAGVWVAVRRREGATA